MALSRSLVCVVGTFVIGMAACSSGGSEHGTPEVLHATPAVSATEPVISESSPTSTPELVESLQPLSSFGDGTYLVGGEIEPGTYQNSDSSSGCYWERLSGFSGELRDVIANEHAQSRQIVTIAAADVGFSSEDCGVWTQIAAEPSAIESPETVLHNLDTSLSRFVAHTGGTGVSLRDSCEDSARVPGAWGDGTAIQVTGEGIGVCSGWSFAQVDGAGSWILDAYIADSPPPAPEIDHLAIRVEYLARCLVVPGQSAALCSCTWNFIEAYASPAEYQAYAAGNKRAFDPTLTIQVTESRIRALCPDELGLG